MGARNSRMREIREITRENTVRMRTVFSRKSRIVTKFAKSKKSRFFAAPPAKYREVFAKPHGNSRFFASFTSRKIVRFSARETAKKSRSDFSLAKKPRKSRIFAFFAQNVRTL